MKWLREKVINLANERFNVIVIAILCAGFIGGIYSQGKSHNNKIDKLRNLYNNEIQVHKDENNNLWKAGNTLFKTYQQERINSSFKDQIIEKQNKAIEQLLKELSYDPSKWI